jgi:hypothetical protein
VLGWDLLLAENAVAAAAQISLPSVPDGSGKIINLIGDLHRSFSF